MIEHRSTASELKLEGYIKQIKWLVEKGAKYDIEDFSGRTQYDIASNIKEPLLREKIIRALITT